ncbi:hypothetical protein AB6A40_009637 [Gnathostoma spinigerum]|uniref:Uncharacterized protein n=1 Tax=Gnathostoma spinigerum TaxID=75299 RepID=A0ABD6ESJ6_9BILA
MLVGRSCFYRTIGDPLIKIIPAYRHRTQSSSCSSTTSGGGQQISPRLSSSSNGVVSVADQFSNRTAVYGASSLNSGLYISSNYSSSTVPSLATSSHLTPPVINSATSENGRHRDGETMLIDPIHR